MKWGGTPWSYGMLILLLLAWGLRAPWAQAADAPAVTLVIGALQANEGGNANPEASPLHSPFGVAFDSRGNMIIVELEGGRVHRMTPSGELTIIGGNGSKGYRGDGKPLREAVFNGMHNVAIAGDDTIYIADSWNHCIRRVDPKTGIITTLAGTGQPGFGGDGGPAEKAVFDFVMCVTLNPAQDKLHVADLKNRRIREVDLKTKIVRTVAGNGRQGVPQDGDRAVDSPLVDPRAVAADSRGNIYLLEREGHALRVIRPDGRIYTVAGTGRPGGTDGPALEAGLNGSKHLCVDDRDRVYIADDLNAAIRRYDPVARTLVRVLGQGNSQPAVFLHHPHGVCVDRGWLYVVDSGNHRILRTLLVQLDRIR